MRVLVLLLALCFTLISATEELFETELQEDPLFEQIMNEAWDEMKVVKMSPVLSFMQIEGYGAYTCWEDLTPCLQSAGCCSRCCRQDTNTCGHSSYCKLEVCKEEDYVCGVDLNCCSVCCKDNVCVDKFQCTKVQWWFIILVYITLPLCVILVAVAGFLSWKRRRQD